MYQYKIESGLHEENCEEHLPEPPCAEGEGELSERPRAGRGAHGTDRGRVPRCHREAPPHGGDRNRGELNKSSKKSGPPCDWNPRDGPTKELSQWSMQERLRTI